MANDQPTSGAPKKGLPAWAYDLFEGYLDHLQEVNRLLHLSMRGVSLLQSIPQALEALAQVGREGSDYEKRLESAREEAKLAATELANDFPLMHGQAVVSLWGSLESLVRSFVAMWIENYPHVLAEKPFEQLKVSLGEYMAMDARDQSRYVVDLLEQKSGSSRALGVNRFEELLKAIAMGGPLENTIADTLFELQQVRNVIVHRRSIADRRLCEKCPQLGLNVGDPVRVRNADFIRYDSAVCSYVLELIQRLRVKHGIGRYATKTKSDQLRENEKAPPP